MRLIGTGKDPEYPFGTIFDIPDEQAQPFITGGVAEEYKGQRPHPVPAFVQTDDPGAAGTGLLWVDTSSGEPALKVRNAANDGWNDVAGGGGSSLWNMVDGISDTSAAAGDYIIATADLTVTLPTAPADGSQVGVLASNCLVTIEAGETDSINGGSSLNVGSDIGNNAYAGVVVVYDQTDAQWFTAPSLPGDWRVDTPYSGDFLYGPWPAQSGVRTLMLGVRGNTDSDGIGLYAVCIAGTTVDLFGGPGDAHLILEADTGASVGASSIFGVQSNPGGSEAAFVAEGGAGAIVSLDCGELPVINLPTVDPHIDGALWNNAGTPAISTG
jgi:hypothetical protein